MSVDVFLKAFYEQYDYQRMKNAYRNLKSGVSYGFKKLYKLTDVKLEVTAKDRVLSMKIASAVMLSMEMMVVIGYFFDKYDDETKCLYTSNGGNMVNFFREGTDYIRKLGGKIKIDIDRDERKKLVKMFTNPYSAKDKKIFDDLCDNFDKLEIKDWKSYYKWVETDTKRLREERHIEKVTCMDLPMDWENLFATSPACEGVHAESAADGLIMSLNNLGKVDIEYIAQITGESLKNVILALKGSIFQNPDKWNECFYKGWETADEYLSGRVVQKWNKAKMANEKYKGYFRDNVQALEKVVPKQVTSSDIYVTLGSPWVPCDIIDDFIVHLFGDWRRYVFEGYRFNEDELKARYGVRHDDITGAWEIPNKARYYDSMALNNTYGTERINGMHILERTLNLKPIEINDSVNSRMTGKKQRVLNKDETVLAQEKQRAMVEEFQRWVWDDPKRKKRLEDIYDDKFGSNIVRRYDGSFLTFPEMNPLCDLYDYQKNAVARILFTPNTLLAHDVGSGKTFIMIAAGMEMKRMGISQKNLYVVPNNIIGQWRDMFKLLYPKAKILCVDSKSFKASKREAVLEDIRDTDYDAIVMAYSCFEMIPVSKEFYAQQLKEQIAQIYKIAETNNKVTKKLDRKREALKAALKELTSEMTAVYGGIYFEDLGINTMFVDEAHNFKNLKLNTTIQCMGINTNGSAKCTDMADKVRIVQKANNGRGVVMATGTPITNSLTDIYVMQQYLQLGELTLMGINSFDAWVGMFAERNTEFEIDVDTSQFRMATRLSRFHNLPELSSLLSAVADFHRADEKNGVPKIDGYTDVLIGKTPDFESYLKDISLRANYVRNGVVSRSEDNMLKITTDGRKAALDMRLVDDRVTFTYQSKVAHCAENVLNVYLKTYADKSAQLVFCDTSTPKEGFNLYDDLKELLVKMGVKEEEIEFIHSAESEVEKRKLFARVRSGETRVLIGSTFKLGLGVNVQDRLIALHHMDVPWRPSDMVQREGRILRQGNQNEKVFIYRYVTQGSFDSYSWQLLEAKQKMIVSILSGCTDERSCDEIDDTVLDYAEVKALAVGDPMIKRRVEVANELARNKTLQRQYISNRQSLEIELVGLPAKIEKQRALIRKCELDIEYYAEHKTEHNKDERKEIRHGIFSKLQDNVLADSESEAAVYQGFKVVLPTMMIPERPFVYLEANGRYMVEMGIVETGTLIRLDNFLNELDKHKARLESDEEKLVLHKKDIEDELCKDNGYTDIIKALEQELASIDKKLGVKR